MSTTSDRSRRSRFRGQARVLLVGFTSGDAFLDSCDNSDIDSGTWQRVDLPNAACEQITAGHVDVVVMRVRNPFDLRLRPVLDAVRRSARCALLGVIDEGVQLGPWAEVMETVPSNCSTSMLLSQVLRLMSEQVRMLSALHAAESHALHRTLHDGLTGLANRALLLDRIDRAMKRSTRATEYGFALVFIDLDRFKLINESQGHTVGDRLLMEVASRIATSVRQVDTVARIAADEFMALLDGITDSQIAMRVAAKIQKKLAQPYNVDGRTVHLSASIGVALHNRSHTEALDIFRDADTAMHAAKAKGRGCQVLFGTALRERAVLLFDIENELPRAIANREIEVFYQPIVRLATDQLIGCEALVRWRHPDRGLISPLDFISVAEATGLIVPLGQYVLTRACEAAREWNDLLNPQGEELRVSVNVSPIQFERAEVTEQVREALDSTGLSPRHLAIEVTESLFINNVDNAIQTLRALREIGVSVYLDDFGTGYSSLSYLVNLPLSVVKIDRSFIKDIITRPEFEKLTRGIVSLAHSLDLQITAEGIEDAHQRDCLSRLGVEYAQGYFYSRPVPAAEFRALLQKSPPIAA